MLHIYFNNDYSVYEANWQYFTQEYTFGDLIEKLSCSFNLV